MVTTDVSIGANIARIRGERGLSLRNLAERLTEIGRPINADGLNRAEKGRRQITAPELVALAVVLDVSPLVLVGYNDHPWQEFNAYGNTCHYPGCRLTYEEHAQHETEVTTLGDLARGERVYINPDGSQRREATR